jgi:hypothetical protein
MTDSAGDKRNVKMVEMGGVFIQTAPELLSIAHCPRKP